MECLQLVIRHLADQPDSHTLASLLCVNKYVCSATLPIMYADPFKLRPFRYNMCSASAGMHVNLFKLVRLLLSLPRGYEGVSDLLRAAFIQEPKKQEQGQDREQGLDQPLPENDPPSIPYYSFITNIDFQHYFTQQVGIFQDILSDRVSFQEYLEQHGQNSRYYLRKFRLFSRSSRTSRHVLLPAISVAT